MPISRKFKIINNQTNRNWISILKNYFQMSLEYIPKLEVVTKYLVEL